MTCTDNAVEDMRRRLLPVGATSSSGVDDFGELREVARFAIDGALGCRSYSSVAGAHGAWVQPGMGREPVEGVSQCHMWSTTTQIDLGERNAQTRSLVVRMTNIDQA
jgi:hypothetical protein